MIINELHPDLNFQDDLYLFLQFRSRLQCGCGFLVKKLNFLLFIVVSYTLYYKISKNMITWFKEI